MSEGVAADAGTSGPLTAEQQQVVAHLDGPAVVIACPGSGKTRALTHRIAHLVTRHQVSPPDILGITFTRAAALEMKQRLAALMPPASVRAVRLYTFHGLAWRIISQARGRPRVLEERAQQALARQVLRHFQLGADQAAVDQLLTDFAFLTGAQVPTRQFRPGSCELEQFLALRRRYETLKQAAGAVDFDDLLVQARDLLAQSPRQQPSPVAGIRYLLVDEFQDTNALQWQLLRLLLGANDNLMVVGDDDQAIYGWRGASPSFMLEFPRHFPGCRELRLTRNFRSSAAIVGPAAALIAVNTRRFDKRFVAVRPADRAPSWARPATAGDEADHVAAAIAARLAAGVRPDQVAVLYRTHLLGLPLMNRLEAAKIPFRVIGGRPNPFTRWMVRDVLAYLRWAHGEASREEMVRILRRPVRRGLSREMVLNLGQAMVNGADILDWLLQRAAPVGVREVHALRRSLARLAELPAGQAITFIRRRIGYDQYIDQYCAWSGSDAREAKDILEALEQMPQPGENSRTYLDLAAQHDMRGGAGDQPGRASPSSTPGSAGDPPTPQVTLTTFHGSKGLEWEEVWILGAVEGAIPHRQVQERGDAAALEEERRLFYVGMTRARAALTVTAPQRLFGADAVPSRFVVESGIWTPPASPPASTPATRARLLAVGKQGQAPRWWRLISLQSGKNR